MSEPHFPPNSEASKREPIYDNKGVEQVTTTPAKKRRRPLRKQLSETFIAGDMKTTIAYVLFDVLLPAAKDTAVDAVHQGMEKLLFGEGRRRGAYSPTHGATGYVSYNRISSGIASRLAGPTGTMSRQAKSRQSFDEIILDNRPEAELVIERLFDVVSQYESASVADLYELVGIRSVHTDHKFGWTNLTGAGVTRVRGGYMLDLPDPHPLD